MILDKILDTIVGMCPWLMEHKNMVTVALVVVIIALLWYRHHKTYSFWSSRGVRGPTPIPIFGNSFKWMTSSVDGCDAKDAAKFGKIYGVYNGKEPVLMVSDAALVEELWTTDHKKYADRMNFDPQDVHTQNGIIFSSGDQWKNERKVFNSSLSVSALKNIDLTGMAKNLLKHLKENEGKVLNMFDTCSLHYIDVVTSIFYGLQMNSFKNPNKQLLDSARDLLSFSNVYTFYFGYNFPNLAKIAVLYFGKASRHIAKFVKFAIDKRLSDRNAAKYKDFLSLVLSTDILSDDLKLGASNEVIGAGFLPVTSSTTFLIYELSRVDPKIMKKLIEEMDRLKEKITERRGEGADPNFEEIRDEMKYLDNCYRESLRFHPAAVRNWRRVTEETVLKTSIGDIQLPVGTSVTVPVPQLHFDPEVFENPKSFEPDRWLDPSIHKHMQTFGSGPRKCVGEPFSYMMVKFTMYHILTNFDIVAVDGSDIRRRPGSFIPHSCKVLVKLIKRKQDKAQSG